MMPESRWMHGKAAAILRSSAAWTSENAQRDFPNRSRAPSRSGVRGNGRTRSSTRTAGLSPTTRGVDRPIQVADTGLR